MRQKNKGIAISTKITVMVLIMVILSSAAIGVFSYVAYWNDSINYQGQKALATAGAIASLIDVEQFKTIGATEEQTDYYLRMKEIFTEANKNVGTLYLYTMIKDDDGIHYKYVFVAETDLGNPMLGGKDTIESYGDFALSAFESGEPVISGIYDNEGYGYLVSAFYPLFDKDGEVAGLVCADIKADNVIEHINNYRSKVILAVLVFVLLFGIISVSYSLHLFGIAKQMELNLQEAHATILSSIEYSSKIQRNLLPLEAGFEQAFSDYFVIWEPRDIVGGDIYWLKKFDEGTVLCVADCTGHGTPGALLTVLVVSALADVVNQENCRDTAGIVWALEQKLVNVFSVKADDRKIGDSEIKDGCDLAILFIAKDKSVTLSSGHTNVFICDGQEVRRIKGQKIYVGEGSLRGKDEIETVHIPANPANKFYIASDGLYEQPGGDNFTPFGFKRLKKILLEYHSEAQSVVSGKIWEAFEEYRGEEPRVDDFELISFKP